MDYLLGFLLGVTATVALFFLKRLLAGDDARPAASGAKGQSDAARTGQPTDAPASRALERRADTAPAIAPETPPPPAQSIRTELYAIASDLDDFFDQTAQPEDLMGHQVFLRGVDLLSGADLSSEDLLSYYRGDNHIIACLAMGALSRGEADSGFLEPILTDLNQVGYWVRHFALRALDRRISEPILARVLSSIDDSWGGRIPGQIFRNFLAKRCVEEPLPTFTELRPLLSEERLEFLEHFLDSLDGEKTSALAGEIKKWRESQADRGTLRSIGKLWEDAPDRDREVIVEFPGLLEAVEKVESSLFKEPRRSVLLVGETGTGKTTLLKLLGHRLIAKEWVVFEAGAKEVLAGQIYMGELEQRIKKLLDQLGGKKKVLWIVPAIHNLLWAGRHKYSPSGVLDILLPSIEKGEIVVAGEASPRTYEVLIQEVPQIRSAFDTCHVEPLGDDETVDLAREWLGRWSASMDVGDAGSSDAPGLGQLLREALQLARQYLGHLGAPGNLMTLLKLTLARLAKKSAGGEVHCTTDALLETLAQVTGLPGSILDERRRLDLSELRQFFDKRVLGQAEAIDCLVERVAMIKAGLTDPTRPQGVFLFAGPTGTGKTEIAKALSEFLFGSEDKIIRLDMSECTTEESLGRILGGGDETRSGRALVDKIRQQPFSVVLLDEFEKAASPVWDLFLQVFDNGRLTDKRGNTADFRHSIVIMTTNLGGNVARAGGIGFAGDGPVSTAQGVDRAVSEVFRQEFINRLDRIVAFRPLSRATMREILYKELDLVLHRRGLRNRSWAVEWEESAIEFLLDRGFDANLGARPLKRAIERYLLSPLAITIVNHQFPGGDQFLFVRSDGRRIVVEFVDPDAPDEEERDGENTADPEEEEERVGPSLRGIVLNASGTRSELQFLRQRYDEIRKRVDAESWKSRKRSLLAQLSSSSFWESPGRFSVLGEAEYMDRIEAGLDTAGSLIRRLSDISPGIGKKLSRDLMRRLAQQVYLLREACSGLEKGRPRDAFLLVRGSRDSGADPLLSDDFARRLGNMYQRWADKRRMRLQILREESGDANHPYSTLMAISGYAAFTILEAEEGLHVFEVPGEARQFQRCKARVQVIAQPDAPARSGADASLEQALSELENHPGERRAVVRNYREKPSPLVRDAVRQWKTGRLGRVLGGDFDLLVG